VAITLTGSRGAYIGAAAGFLGFLVIAGTVIWKQSKSNKWLLLTLAALGILMAAFLLHRFPGYEQRILSIFAGREHSSNSFRLNVWLSCLSMFKDNWLTGIGVGNQTFRLAYGLYMRSGFDALAAYSVPLEVGVEAGITALLCFALIILSALCRAHIFFWNKATAVFDQTEHSAKLWLDSDSISEAMTAGAALALLALLVHGLVDTVFFRPQIQFIFFLMLVLLAGVGSNLSPAVAKKEY
jgi:putative inorganic carbon (HCO3(-)) transporter